MTSSDGGNSRAAASDTGALQPSRVLTITGAPAVRYTYTPFLPPLLPAFFSKLALDAAADPFGQRVASVVSAVIRLLGLPFVVLLPRGNP